MKRWLNRAAMARGYTLARRVSSAEVLKLIRTLRAHSCGVPLIRIGASRDGGYLVPDDLAGIEYCFSPGVNRTADFECALADRSIHCFLADHSVEGPPVARADLVFDRKFIGATNDETFMTMTAWKDKYLPGYRGELLLQMDIEGAEYEVILSTPPEVLGSFRIMVLELHWLDRLFDPFAFSIMQACFRKLLSSFFVVHAHPNNCSGMIDYDGIAIPEVMELTFYSRARAAPGAYRDDYPHALDADNCERRPAMVLPECWR